METEKFEALPEDIYVLEAAGLGLISVKDGLMRVMAVNADVRCAFTVTAAQLSYVSEKTDFLKLYPDPRQISVLRMVFTNELVREFRLLETSLREKMIAEWERAYSQLGEKATAKSKGDKDRYGRVWMICSNAAFDAMDMTLVPEPGESSEHWDKMIAVAESLKNNS